MSEVTIKLQRILLPLDVSRDSLTALDIAFELAAATGGEVTGLFIEDAELLAAGRLPFTGEVGSASGIRRRIASEDILHRFQAVAGKARDLLAQAGNRVKVRSSFRVGRGHVPTEILSATTDADMIVLGKAGWSPGAFRKPGGTCSAILSQSQIPVLIVERDTKLSPPILAIHDDTAAGQRALEFARELSRSLGWKIVVFAAHGMSTGDEVLQRIRQHKPHLIVLPSSLPFSEKACQLKCALLVVP
jgi:nucleotide-binding universal stress UspA family protein